MHYNLVAEVNGGRLGFGTFPTVDDAAAELAAREATGDWPDGANPVIVEGDRSSKAKKGRDMRRNRKGQWA